MKTPQNILLRMPDLPLHAIEASTLIFDLRQAFPKVKLTLMCEEGVSDLFIQDPNVDEVFSFIQPSGWLHRIEARNILNPLKHGKYDLGILTDCSLASAWWFWRGKIPHRLGFAYPSCRPLLTIPVPVSSEYKKLLAPLGIKLSDTNPMLYISPQEKKEGMEMLHRLGAPRGGNVLTLHPGPEGVSEELIRQLIHNPGVFLILLGTADQSTQLQTLCHKLPESVVNLAGKMSLRETMSILKNVDLLISKDETTTMLGSALGTSTLPLQNDASSYEKVMQFLERKAL